MRFFASAKGCCAAAAFALGALMAAPAPAQMALNPEVKDQRSVRPRLTEAQKQPAAGKNQAVRKARRAARRKPGR
jgi:hypothetical protein